MNFSVWTGGLDKPEETAEGLASHGVPAVEMHSEPFFQSDEKTIEAGARTFRERGIRIFSVHAPFGDDDSLSGLDDEKREKAVDKHRTLLHKTAPAGVSVLVIHPGARAEEKDMPRMEDILLPSLEILVETAEELDVKLALENMLPDHPGCESTKLRGTVEKICSPYLGICFDTGHAHVVEEGVRNAFETLKDLVVALHIQDNDGTHDMHLQPPYGTIDWDEFSRLLGEIHFEDPMLIEASPWAGASAALMLSEVEAVFEGRQALVDLDGRKIRPVCPVCNRYIFESEGGRFCGCGKKC